MASGWRPQLRAQCYQLSGKIIYSDIRRDWRWKVCARNVVAYWSRSDILRAALRRVIEVEIMRMKTVR